MIGRDSSPCTFHFSWILGGNILLSMTVMCTLMRNLIRRRVWASDMFRTLGLEQMDYLGKRSLRRKDYQDRISEYSDIN